jgi:hypothetical protein
MISPSSALGMLASWICLIATVSPLVKLRAPDGRGGWSAAPRDETCAFGPTVDGARSALAEQVAELLRQGEPTGRKAAAGSTSIRRHEHRGCGDGSQRATHVVLEGALGVLLECWLLGPQLGARGRPVLRGRARGPSSGRRRVGRHGGRGTHSRSRSARRWLEGTGRRHELDSDLVAGRRPGVRMGVGRASVG